MVIVSGHRYRLWKWWRPMDGNIERRGRSVWTATRRRRKRAVAVTRWQSILSNSVGIGSSRPRNTKPTTVQVNVPTSFYRNTRTRTLSSKPIRPEQPGRVAHLEKCRPFRCSTSTTSSTSFTAIYPVWSSIGVDVPKWFKSPANGWLREVATKIVRSRKTKQSRKQFHDANKPQFQYCASLKPPTD